MTIRYRSGEDRRFVQLPTLPHPCPYAEIDGDYDTLCTCSEEQMHECAMAI